MNQQPRISRRVFHATAGSALALAATPSWAKERKGRRAVRGDVPPSCLPTPRTIKCLCCDLNWAWKGKDSESWRATTPEDYAVLDPQAYFDYHREVGNNVMFLQAYTVAGFAFYPTKLGPTGAGKSAELLPRLWDLSRKAKLPFMSYMDVGYDFWAEKQHPEWIVPGIRRPTPNYLAPESGWTELLCRRIREFLGRFPVEWLLFDMFGYGPHPNDFQVQPAPFMERPFREIIGRPMPAKAGQITPEENLKYKRETLARQFHAIRNAVKETCPHTQIGFNVPYEKPYEPLWRDHPMLTESEMLITECTLPDVMEWAVKVKKPKQRVMMTFFGRPDGVCDPKTWRTWYERGCDLFAYVWGLPPDFRPVPRYDEGMKVVREAFRSIP
jgi:hypothetical protein